MNKNSSKGIPQKKYSVEIKEKVIKAFKQGVEIEFIVARFGVSRQAAQKWIQDGI